jgi:hypothetical protein
MKDHRNIKEEQLLEVAEQIRLNESTRFAREGLGLTDHDVELTTQKSHQFSSDIKFELLMTWIKQNPKGTAAEVRERLKCYRKRQDFKLLLAILKSLVIICAGAYMLNCDNFIAFPNGDKYKGDVINGTMHGRGEMTYADGSTYAGQWSDGLRHGTGTFTHTNGNQYRGQWVDGLPSGTGSILYTDGCVFYGNWQRGLTYSHGTFKFPSGHKYEGQFSICVVQEGSHKEISGEPAYTRMDGELKYSYCTSSRKYGLNLVSDYSVKNNKHEISEMHSLDIFLDGYSYKRQYCSLDTKHQGYVAYSFRPGKRCKRIWSGKVYGGRVTDFFPEGYGTARYRDGSWYSGQYKNGSKNGRGRYRLPNGDRYDGQWANDKMHGIGTYTWADGTQYVGQWLDDAGSGRGVMRYANGAVYDGEWKNGVRHGNGTCRYSDGNVYVGVWENGKKCEDFSTDKSVMKSPH